MRLALATVLLTSPALLTGQETASTRPGKRAILPRAQEIALARSAAPSEVSGAATIYVLTDTGYAVGHQGTNGNACLVDRSWPESLEPTCYDSEAAATVMQTTLVQMAGVQRGTPVADIDRALADGLRSGRFRLPGRPAMSYMMSSAQKLISDDGRPAGNWQPHLMLFVPYITGEQLGLGATPNPAAAIVVNPGQPSANIMVIVKKFVDPVIPGGAR
jgi:hypothetical protein